jgi:hypothetical protein
MARSGLGGRITQTGATRPVSEVAVTGPDAHEAWRLIYLGDAPGAVRSAGRCTQRPLNRPDQLVRMPSGTDIDRQAPSLVAR